MLGLASNQRQFPRWTWGSVAVGIIFTYGMIHFDTISLKTRYALYRYQKVTKTLSSHYPDVSVDELALKLEAEHALSQAKIHWLNEEIKELRSMHKILDDHHSDQQKIALARKFYSPGLQRKHLMMIQPVMEKEIFVGKGVFFESDLMGQVVSQKGRLSLVRLITHPDSLIPVEDEAGSLHAMAKGIGNPFILELDMIEGDESKMSEGMTLLSSGDGKLFPYGLQVGSLIKKNHKWYIKANHSSPSSHWVVYMPSGL